MDEAGANTASADELAPIRAELERMLGKCLLQLQAYELLMKAIASDHATSFAKDDTGTTVRGSRANFERKTLGEVVGHVVGGYFASEGAEMADRPDIYPDFGPVLSVRVQITVSDDEFSEMKARLKEFVALRNTLVHQFLAMHDLSSVAGCRAALLVLETTSTQIDQHITEARTWLQSLVETKKYAAEVFDPEAFVLWLNERRKASDA
ncbi:hypothetical protein [Paragemmobacter straminiformis]|uniref:Uncharacterized protein n=1 Tax=Paragemmobacter straminiformis TaxID=2045119 RepID=A0A842I3R5_9RHOB|nr:hypothetical protein [Gemmobacter straminiformis]MBC2834077.1 hypothetical protein [Gemmobacter straminiformis]